MLTSVVFSNFYLFIYFSRHPGLNYAHLSLPLIVVLSSLSVIPSFFPFFAHPLVIGIDTYICVCVCMYPIHIYIYIYIHEKGMLSAEWAPLLKCKVLKRKKYISKLSCIIKRYGQQLYIFKLNSAWPGGRMCPFPSHDIPFISCKKIGQRHVVSSATSGVTTPDHPWPKTCDVQCHIRSTMPDLPWPKT